MNWEVNGSELRAEASFVYLIWNSAILRFRGVSNFMKPAWRFKNDSRTRATVLSLRFSLQTPKSHLLVWIPLYLGLAAGVCPSFFFLPTVPWSPFMTSFLPCVWFLGPHLYYSHYIYIHLLFVLLGS